MKPEKLWIIAVLSLVLVSTYAHGVDTAAAQKGAVQAKDATFVKAYYFHGKFRCQTCRTIEQYSRDAVKLNFPEQLKSGELVFQIINYDEPENQHFVQDYQLVTRSLVLVKFVNGKQTAWKNLPSVWQKVGDRKAFFEYVKSETAAYL